MASPSGRACEVMTKRCRWRMASRVAATGSAIIRIVRCRPVGYFSQQLLDAVLMPDALVELESHFRRPPQAKALADLPPHEACRAIERAGGVLARGRVAEARIEHARVLQVGADLHASDGDESHAGIVQLARDHHADFRANRIRDALRSRALTHRCSALCSRL